MVGQALLQSRATLRYCKVEQELFQSLTGNLLQNEVVASAKWCRYYKVG